MQSLHLMVGYVMSRNYTSYTNYFLLQIILLEINIYTML